MYRFDASVDVILVDQARAKVDRNRAERRSTNCIIQVLNGDLPTEIRRHVELFNDIGLALVPPSVKTLTIRGTAHSGCRIGTLSLQELMMPEPSIYIR